jgi:hypothetical protein
MSFWCDGRLFGRDRDDRSAQSYAPRNRFTSGDVLEAVPQLKVITDEKGSTCTGVGWEKGSLFAFIDELGSGSALAKEMKTFDMLVCVDLGTEIVDFIAARQGPPGRRACRIHPRQGLEDGHPTSASELNAICGQAVRAHRGSIPISLVGRLTSELGTRTGSTQRRAMPAHGFGGARRGG